MMFNKIKLVAQAIGFLCVGLLAVYGGVVAATGAPPAWASGPGAAPGAPSGITPQLISYQGTLRDADDNPAQGTYNMVVRIFDNAGATGSPRWFETHNNVAVREGHFNLLLGQTNPIPASIFASPERYIQLTVDGVAMTPTQRFAAVPYAIAATYATQLSAPDGDPADAVTVDNNGNVGIGTTSPDRPLTIQGSGTNSAWISFKDKAGTTQWHVNHYNNGLNFGESQKKKSRLFLDVGGNVGIGTTDPQAKLDVEGGAKFSGNVGIRTDPDPGARNSLSVSGKDNDGTNAALKVSSPGQTMLIDGNEISVADNGTLYLNHNSTGKVRVENDLDVNGTINADGLTIDNHKPIFFQYLRYGSDHSYSNWYSSYSSDKWSCGVVGFQVDGDINEKGRQTPLLKVWAWVKDNKWVFSLNQSENDTWEHFEALIMCVDNDLVDWKPDWSF